MSLSLSFSSLCSQTGEKKSPIKLLLCTSGFFCVRKITYSIQLTFFLSERNIYTYMFILHFGFTKKGGKNDILVIIFESVKILGHTTNLSLIYLTTFKIINRLHYCRLKKELFYIIDSDREIFNLLVKMHVAKLRTANSI